MLDISIKAIFAGLTLWLFVKVLMPLCLGLAAFATALLAFMARAIGG